MKTFQKIIESNSNEHNALKILKGNVNFLPILELKRNGVKTVVCTWPKLKQSFLVKRGKRSGNMKMELECWSQVKHQLKLLHEKKIHHGDLHFGNVMCGVEKGKELYYIIDFGECSNPKNLTVYEKNALLFDEDLFQLLWNFVFGSNQMQNDFSGFRKLFQKQSLENQEMVWKKVKHFYKPSHYKRIKQYYDDFVKKKKPVLKDNVDHIRFKFFLERMYLAFYLLFVKPNGLYLEFVENFKK